MRRLNMIFSLMLSLLLYACSNGTEPSEVPSFESGKLSITLEYEKQSGYASNQYAVWIEDMYGNYIDTLYATRYTANGGYKNRPDSIPTWVEKSGLADMKKSEVDAVAGATPDSGIQTYTWDLADADGGIVPDGEYKFFVEGSLRWKNRVVYSGTIIIGRNSSQTTVEADASYVFEASDDQPELSSESPEVTMLSAVSAVFTPPAKS